MVKKANSKLLLIALFLAILIVISGCEVLMPKVNASAITPRQKGLAVLGDVIGLDLTKYNVATEENSQYLPSLSTPLRENILYNLNSANSNLRTIQTFVNGNLQGIFVLENDGTPNLSKTGYSIDAVENAQEFLSNYQTYTGKQIFGELGTSLNNVDASRNLTKTFENKALEVTAYGDDSHFKWYYTANGAAALYTKVVSIGFRDGFMTSFIDNWDLYSIGSTNVNLSKEEAVSIALDTAKEHSWTVQLDEDALDPSNFNEKRSVSWTTLAFDGSFDADKIRSENVLELFPVWRVGIVLNKVYGELYGIEVDIWADTKEVRSVKEEYSQLAAQWFANSTANVDTTEALTSGVELNFLMETVLSATIVSLMGAFTVLVVKKKKPRAFRQLKPHFLKVCIMLLGFLLISMVFLPSIAFANATSRAGNIWGARSTGAPNAPYSFSWRKTDDEIDKQWYVSDYIVSHFFTPANGYSGYNHEATNKDQILYQGEFFSEYYDYVAIVDWNHGVGGFPGQAPGYPNVPENEQHYMFEDDWGTVVGSRPGTSDWSHGVYDIDMYNTFPPAKVHFAFIDACQSANLWRLGQGFYSGTGNPVGLPFAFTHRIVSYVPAGYTGTAMSDDGYNRPDAFPQCYIGFPQGSAALDQRIDRYGDFGTGPKWYEWIIFFFYFALNFDIPVKDALDMASYMQWQCNGFQYSPLQGSGFTAVWPMDLEWPWGVFEEGPNQQGPHSTLEVYGNGNIHLKNFQPSHMVTWPSVDGPTICDPGVYYTFNAHSIDSHQHTLRYVFDWGDGSPYTYTYYYPNGESVSAAHKWNSEGIYNIRVKAQCESGTWSSWSNPYTVRIGTYHWLYVDAYDANYGYELNPNVYIDSEWVGNAPVSVLVTEDWHSVEVDDWWGYWYFVGFSDGYGNGESRPIYSDTSITAWYWPIF